jgi:histidyl-tRNA synthetase
MALVSARTMPGVMELLPREQIALQAMLDTIRRSYESFGFLPVETPVMEYTDVLLTKSGGETEKQVYFVQSTGALQQSREAELALRFDLTVPLARYVAEHEGQLVFPFRRYQIQRVYRGESAQRGRFREFYQCDIDVIGKDKLSLAHDAEIPAIIDTLFRELDFGPFTIRINNRKLLSGLFEDLGVADGEAQKLVLREVDKLDKRGRDAVIATLSREPFGLDAGKVSAFLDFASAELTNAELLDALDRRESSSARYRQGAAELRQVMEQISLQGVPEDNVRIDLTIARGLDYYTGTIYETVLRDHPKVGSVCSGGRYDDLASFYTKSKLPGVGISIGATRLFDQLRAVGLIETSGTGQDVLVTRFDPRYQADNLRIAAALRAAGLRVEVVHEDWSPKKQLQYASRQGVPFVLIQGESEAAEGVVSVKDMRSGEQQKLPVEGLPGLIRASL